MSEVESQPTLVELIDGKGTKMGKHGPIAFASADLAAIRETAVALETEYATARAELSTKAVEYLQVFKQMENLQEQYDLESAEADRYAKRAHALDDLVMVFYTNLGLADAPLDDEWKARLTEVVHRVTNRPPPRIVKPRTTTVVTAETAPLVPLEA